MNLRPVHRQIWADFPYFRNVMNKWVYFLLMFSVLFAIYTLTSKEDAFWKHLIVSLATAIGATLVLTPTNRLVEYLVRKVLEKIKSAK